jgi:hypothetical protein
MFKMRSPLRPAEFEQSELRRPEIFVSSDLDMGEADNPATLL